MGKSNTGELVLFGALILGGIYMLTRNRSTTTSPSMPTQPTVQQQTQQLQQWAQTQSAGSTILNIIKSLDFNQISDMWSKIFGSSGSSTGDYSGGGTDVPYNPYPEYDPYNSNDGSIYA
jgi:predicted metalloprotease